MNRKASIKLVIFDAYGVALSGGYPATCEYLAKKYKLNFEKIYSTLYKQYFNQAAERMITQKEAWDLGLKELKIPLTTSEIKKIHYGLMNINLEVLRVKEAIEKKNIKTLLLSKNTRSQFYEINEHLHFKKFFKNYLNTWELNISKASREALEYVMKKFKVNENEILIIDDQEENLSAAKKMGIKTIFYKNFNQFKKELNNYLK